MPRKAFSRYVLWFSVVGAMLVLCPALRAQDAAPPVCQASIITDPVKADRSIVQGTPSGQSCVYLGIPYAAPPVGTPKEPADPGRWRPPAAVTPWHGVKSFKEFGHMCPQLMGTTAMGNEDCLNVNVFSPPHQGPLPVLFMIHGSGNQKSSNRAEAGSSLDGQYFAEHGPAVVVVTNYRLGALGWLAHAALDAESATGTSGNYGMLDQMAALQWVQRNIAAFGGDPSRVTVTGHSAGAQDTGVLFASPLAQGLFASILIDGGGFAQFDSPTLADYEATVGAEVVTKLGCANAADIPACLRALPSATIVRKTLGPGGLFTDAYYRPNIDGFVLNDNALQTAKEGAHNHVPLIIGGGARETANPGTFIPLPPDPNSIPTDAAYQAVIYDRFGQTVGDQILALYPSAAYPTARDALIAVSTDYRFLCPARQLARAVSNSQHEPVYRFVFTHAQSGPLLPADPLTGIPLATKQGAWHGEELQFVFHSFTSGAFGPFTPTADELTLSDQMIGYWARFAATGNPSGGNALVWPVYGMNADNNGQGNMFINDTATATGDDKKDTFFQFDTPLAEGAGFHAEVCENFWDVLVGDTNNGHGEGSIAGDIDENAGNEAFITDADLDNDDQPQGPPGSR